MSGAVARVSFGAGEISPKPVLTGSRLRDAGSAAVDRPPKLTATSAVCAAPAAMGGACYVIGFSSKSWATFAESRYARTRTIRLLWK